MAGSNHFLIDRESDSFKRSFKKLYKSTAVGLKETLLNQLESVISGLAVEQRPASSRQEPCPKKLIIPPLCEFRKLEEQPVKYGLSTLSSLTAGLSNLYLCIVTSSLRSVPLILRCEISCKQLLIIMRIRGKMSPRSLR